jgi:hypothetical protein
VGIDWTDQLADQLDVHWHRQLRPRYEGLTDSEYFWEPVANCWNIRPRGQGRAAMAAGGGEFVIDYADPEPSPAPVTTIAWRLAQAGCKVDVYDKGEAGRGASWADRLHVS